MKVIIGYQTSEVTQIDRLAEETIFHVATGERLRVGLPPAKLEKGLKIDLSEPPSSLPTHIFYHPFMARPVYEIVSPIVRTHPDIQRAFAGHPKLLKLKDLDYDGL